MFVQDEPELKEQYYHLLNQSIYHQQVIDLYQQFGDIAPLLEDTAAIYEGMVHDLANGLNAIRNRLEHASELTLASPDRPLIKQAITLCDGCGWRLIALQEIGPSSAQHLEPLNLPEKLHSMLDTYHSRSSQQPSISFISSKERLIVPNYDNKLLVAFWELLIAVSQACKPDGKITLSIQDLPGKLVQVDLIYEGIEEHDLFDRFALDTTSSEIDHRSLCLHISHQIIAKHRGTLSIDKGRLSIQLRQGNPQPEWDDEHLLALELEKIRDLVLQQERTLEIFRAQPTYPHQEYLTRLARLAGQLSAPITGFIGESLAKIQNILTLLDNSSIEDHIRHIVQQCLYCELVIGNLNVLNPTYKGQRLPLDVNQVIQTVVQLMQWRIQAGTQVILELGSDLGSIHADFKTFGAVILNVLRNALDATGRDGLVRLQTSQEAQILFIRISNLGMAMGKKELMRAFDLDFTTRKRRKYGLGLYVAWQVATALGGTLALSHFPSTSETCLTISLPLMITC